MERIRHMTGHKSRCQMELGITEAVCYLLLLPLFIAVDALASGVSAHAVLYRIGSCYYYVSTALFKGLPLIVFSFSLLAQDVANLALLAPGPMQCSSIVEKYFTLLLLMAMIFRAFLLGRHRNLDRWWFESGHLFTELSIYLHLIHASENNPVVTLLVGYSLSLPVDVVYAFLQLPLTPQWLRVGKILLNVTQWISLGTAPLYGTIAYMSLQMNGGLIKSNNMMLMLAAFVTGTVNVLLLKRNIRAMRK